jgi:[protein-PII] uridylyltransferase
VGLLYDISRALAASALNISLAKITTEKGAAVDSFYVTEHNGSKILNLAREHVVREKLLQAIGGPARIENKRS